MSVQQKRHFRQGLHNIYNMALSENWGYSPMKNAMFMDFYVEKPWKKTIEFG